ncbi:uncharacterized protein isoform X1 [Takifugu rubripes]|uniref:uncharacterized protein isoform X1 n=1 Tax=Takifugu rubripes TaxID=31033 RepID=UPI0011455A16|nr:uncharacterized protein LOC105417368 isoform X1 [Takifugu rubripes]
MNDQPPPIDIDSVLVQLALQTRENALKKREIHLQIKGFSSDIAGRKALIQALEINIEKLTEEIKSKQNALAHHTETSQSIKASNSRLHQYEQSLKEKAQSQLSSYRQELEDLEKKYTSCKNTFQSYKEYYCQHPLAQKLLKLQSDKEGIERRIKAYDEEITIKEKSLAHLTGNKKYHHSLVLQLDIPLGPLFSLNNSTDISTTSDEITDRADQKPLKESEKQLSPPAVEDRASIDISSFHTVETAANTEDIHEEHDQQDTAHCIAAAEETGNELLSTHQQLNEQTSKNENHSEKQDQETLPEKVNAEQSSVEGTGEEDDQNMNVTAMEEEEASVPENTEVASMCTGASQETNLRSPSTTGKTEPSTPTFKFNPGFSALQETPDNKSPAFPFSLSSDPSPAVFPGFRFDMGSLQDEDISFGFTGPFFSEKKTTDSKATSPKFVFNQQKKSGDFQFGFASKSPQKDNKDTGLPFSFNF